MAGSVSWLFKKEQLSHTPSIRNGYTEEKESTVRQQAANLIQTMGQKMHLSQLCINTAIVYMHRFYMLQSLQRFPYKKMASAFIFLAAKVEEQPKKIEYVIKTYCYIHNRSEDGRPIEVDVRSQDYLEKVQELVINENILLQTLGFKVTIDHSNTHVVRLCQMVKAPKDLSQLSYFLSTNSLLLTNLCLRYTPQVIAATCIYLSCKCCDWELQPSKEGKDWWHYIAPSLTAEQLEEYSDIFLSVMEKADPKIINQLIAKFKHTAEMSPNSRPNSPVPTPSSSSRPQSTSHKLSSGHSHSSLSEKASTSKSLSKPSTITSVQDPASVKKYGEFRDKTSKSRPHHVESPLARNDLKRPHPKESHPSSARVSGKPHDAASSRTPVPSYSNNPYAKPHRNNESSKSKHQYHHRHQSGSATEPSPVKKQRLAGENGNGEQRPPLPPQPPLPKPPPPP
ncbi:cyclin-T2-like [Watersipora subatra]|uniref:cyclin-T2-like n=1 Tax=Watersipora subatra TaxID=2589382 RepID=UPI00355BED0D